MMASEAGVVNVKKGLLVICVSILMYIRLVYSTPTPTEHRVFGGF